MQLTSGSVTAGTSDLTAVDHVIGSKDKCAGCGKRGDKCKGHKRDISKDRNESLRKYLKLTNPNIPEIGFACDCCHQKYIRYATKNDTPISSQYSDLPSSQSAELELEDECEMTISKVREHSHKCVICDKNTRIKLSKKAMVNIFAKKTLFASGDIRCCKEHYLPGTEFLDDLYLKDIKLAKNNEGQTVSDTKRYCCGRIVSKHYRT